MVRGGQRRRRKLTHGPGWQREEEREKMELVRREAMGRVGRTGQMDGKEKKKEKKEEKG